MTPPNGDADTTTQSILEKRAARLRLVTKESASDDELLVAQFSPHDERYAFPLEAICAASSFRGVTHVPLAPPHVLGLVRFEGRVICVYSLPLLLGFGSWHKDPEVLLVLQCGADKLIACDCDEVPRAIAVSKLQTMNGKRIVDSDPILEVTTASPRTLFLIDPARFYARAMGHGT